MEAGFIVIICTDDREDLKRYDFFMKDLKFDNLTQKELHLLFSIEAHSHGDSEDRAKIPIFLKQVLNKGDWEHLSYKEWLKRMFDWNSPKSLQMYHLMLK